MDFYTDRKIERENESRRKMRIRREMRREEMKEEKEKKAQESIYLRIEKRVLAYSVTSGASERRDASVFCLAKHRDAIRRDASCRSLHHFRTRVIYSRIEQLND